MAREPGRELAAVTFWLPVPGAEFTPERMERSGLAAVAALWGPEVWSRF
jgi:hypothetical protein